ncbi:MAG: hypothetical protein IKB53_01715 [Oscillospiraceae bacterium]|nr:hypothetical protein [Oscillospiraceae bacterium]
MKKVILILTLCLTLLLCGCVGEGDIIGVWSGSGTVSVIGVGVEDAAAPMETWTFRGDGTAMLEVDSEEALPMMDFTYTFEEGVLTLTAGSRSVEIPCEQAGNTLVFDPQAEDPAIFNRAG